MIKRRVLYFTYQFGLPINPLHDDIYLVEFPKSGVTWLSFLLGNIELKLEKIDEKITFYNHHKWIVDVHQLRSSYINRNLRLQRTYIKSHDSYNPNYYFVVYLIRNPFDVMVSYYNFMLEMGSYTNDFISFVKNPNFGALAWKRHVNNWLYSEVKAQRVHLIKYENLVRDTENCLTILYDNLGKDLDKSIIKESIQLSSLENMQESEKNYRNYNPSYRMNFVGKNKKISKDCLLTDEIVEYINITLYEEIKRFYPEYLTLNQR